jgi:5-dehydro-2-deoxygluconokinase
VRASERYDVLTMGRSGVDLYPVRNGVALEDVEQFGRFLGGTASNVAVAAARHGRRSAVITRTGDDPFGRFIHRALRQLGVDDAYVSSVRGLPTPIAFCEMRPPDDFPLWFYRWPKAPDSEIQSEELDFPAIAQARVFWATLGGLAEDPSRTAHLRAWDARGPKSLTILDLDYRPTFWSTRAEAGRWAREAISHTTVVIGNLEEVEVALGEKDPYRAARVLIDRGVELAVIKKGPRGVLGVTSKEVVELPAFEVQVVNGLGAGDGFGGALCHGLLSGWPLLRILQFASAAGAIVASRIECSSAMPTTAEVEAFLNSLRHPKGTPGVQCV